MLVRIAIALSCQLLLPVSRASCQTPSAKVRPYSPLAARVVRDGEINSRFVSKATGVRPHWVVAVLTETKADSPLAHPIGILALNWCEQEMQLLELADCREVVWLGPNRYGGCRFEWITKHDNRILSDWKIDDGEVTSKRASTIDTSQMSAVLDRRRVRVEVEKTVKIRNPRRDWHIELNRRPYPLVRRPYDVSSLAARGKALVTVGPYSRGRGVVLLQGVRAQGVNRPFQQLSLTAYSTEGQGSTAVWTLAKPLLEDGKNILSAIPAYSRWTHSEHIVWQLQHTSALHSFVKLDPRTGNINRLGTVEIGCEIGCPHLSPEGGLVVFSTDSVTNEACHVFSVSRGRLQPRIPVEQRLKDILAITPSHEAACLTWDDQIIAIGVGPKNYGEIRSVATLLTR